MDDELKKPTVLYDNAANGSQLIATNLPAFQEKTSLTKEELTFFLFKTKTKEIYTCWRLFTQHRVTATFTDSVIFFFTVSRLPIVWYYSALSKEEKHEFWSANICEDRSDKTLKKVPTVRRSLTTIEDREKDLKAYLKELKKRDKGTKAVLSQPAIFAGTGENLVPNLPEGKYVKHALPVLNELVGREPSPQNVSPELNIPKTNYSRIEYNRLEVGESPARPARWPKVLIKRRRIRNRTFILKNVRASKFLHARARAVIEKAQPLESNGFLPVKTKRIPRWQEKRPALLHHAARQREKIREKIVPTKLVHSDWKKAYKRDVELLTSSISWRGLEFQGDAIRQLELNPPRVGLPFDVAGWTAEPRELSDVIRAERLKAPLTGPRMIPIGFHTARIFQHIRAAEHWGTTAVPHRLAGEAGRELAQSYSAIGEVAAEDAEVRVAEADYEAKKLRYRRSLALESRRPARTVRIGDRKLGRRPRPNLSPTTRPKRRRTRRAHAVLREVNTLGLGPLPQKATPAHGIRVRLPRRYQQVAAPKVWDEVYETPHEEFGKRARLWGRYRLGTDPKLAQARYRWWCKWHALDPDCFSELARQGKDINDWVGRENTGWWRLRAPRQRDSINKHKGKARREGAKPEAQHLLTSFKPQPIEVFEAEAWSDTRQNPWGWGTRKYFEQNPFYDYGITIPGLECEPYYNQLGRWNDEATTLSPFTLAFLLGSIQIRYFSFKLVQEDFLFALGLLLKREGAVDREPDWRFWLLEAFGLTRKRAAIRIYEPEPDRDLIRNVGWAKRDWPFFLYRLSWLRELHHGYKPSVYEGPRPTLLVGTPGTGKTSRVRIFADESKTPIIYQSLNAFGEATKIFTRLGIGKNTSANSVKRGFIEARRRTPVIYFLDELDALGAKRPTTFRDIRNITLPTGRLEDWEKERDETIDEREERKFLKQRDEEDQDKEGDRLFGLTQLLKEIDSPLQNKGILFIGATNRPQVLDPALIRPGRFANIRVIPPPNRVKRLSILKLYRGRLRAPLSVDWQFLAARTATYNGAHLACLANQAAIQAILYHQGPGTPIIQDRHFDKALRILRDNTSIKHKTTPERKRDTAELIPWERVAKAYYRAAAAVVSWSLKGDEGLAGVILEHDKLPIDPNQYETKPQGVETRLDQRNNLAVYRAGRASLTALQRTWAPDISKATEKSVYTLLDSRAAVRHARSLVNTKYQKRTLWYWKEIEFIKDRYLGEYTVQHENTGRLEPRSKNTPLPETALETVYSAWEYEEWACEWFDFEGPEYNTWRSILWIPPEVHIIDPHQFGPKLKLGRAGNIIPKYYEQYVFDYIGNAYRRALKALDNNRAALDLYAAFLLKHGTLSRTNGKKLAPGIWEKGDSPQLQK